MIEPVPNEVLANLAELRPAEPRRATSGASHRDIDVRAWCDVHNVTIRREKPWINGATVFELETCVFNPDHNHGEAAIIKLASGMLLYKCLHASCDKKTWTGVRKLFGEAGTRRQTRAGAQSSEQNAPGTARDPDDTNRLTDVGNARRLVAAYGEDLRYCKAWKSWVVWDGCRWVRDQRDQVIEYAKAITAEFFREAAAALDPDMQRMLAGHALKSQRAERLRAMVLLAQSEPGIPVLPTELDANSYVLNVLNGTIDLRTGALREHRRTDLITKLAPVEYSPDAQLALWDRFLGEAAAGCAPPEGPQATDAAQNAAALRDFLQRAAGYSLTGDTSDEVLFLIHGPEAAGKSTFVEALKATLGDYALTADFETFLAKKGDGGVRNDVARLVGARFVASIEVEEGKKLAEGLVKQLTGGDTVSARFLYAEFFEFTPAFKLWLAVNTAPRVTDHDGAMWRRILRVPFEHTVPKEKRDKTIKATLKNPAVAGPGILAWLVAGCLAWQREGLGVPAVIEAATAQYRADQDPLREFYAQCCVFEAQAWVASAVLYLTYQNWARENGLRPSQVLTSTAVGKRLRARGCLPKPGEIVDDMGKRKARGWTGLRLRTEEDDCTSEKPPDPEARSEQEHVGTRTSGSSPHTRARGDNKCEERVPTCSDPFSAHSPGARCPNCGGKDWTPPLVTAAALEPALARVTSAREIVLDVETDGLEPFLAGHRLIGLAIEADGTPFYFAFRHRAGANLPEAALARVLEAALQPGRPILGHNLRFDALLMALEGERWYHLLLNPDGVPLEDTGLHAQLHNECEPNASLDALGQRYLGDAAMKRARKAELLAALRALYPTRSVAMMRRLHPGETLSTAELRALHPHVKDGDLMSHLAELPPEQVAPYATADVADTRALGDYYRPLLAAAGHETLARELGDFSRLLAQIEHRGILVDRQLCLERIAALQAESAAQLAALQAVTTPTFNPRATKDVQAVFGLTGSTSKEVLATLADPRAQQVIDARRTRTEVYDGLLRYLGADDILHPHFHLAAGVDGEGGTRTGRLSSRNPNLQNLPKRDITTPLLAARQAIIARPGFVLLKFDYEKAEPWMAAHYSHSKALYDVYHGGLNLYEELTKRVGGDYQAAKSAWLSIPYGSGVTGLMRRYGWSREKAEQVRTGFFTEYPEIGEAMRRTAAEVMQTGGVTLWTGRRLHFNADLKRAVAQRRKQQSVDSDVSYLAWNSLIQGGVGEMVRVAMQRLERPLAAVGAFMILQCHDEIVIECPVDVEDAVVTLTCEQMTAFDFWLRPRVECERGENYWDMTKIREAVPSPRLNDSV